MSRNHIKTCLGDSKSPKVGLKLLKTTINELLNVKNGDSLCILYLEVILFYYYYIKIIFRLILIYRGF